MDKFRLAVFTTQSPHLYKGGVERRINETMCRFTGQVDVTVYSGTKAGFKKPLNVEGVTFVPLASTDRVYPLDNWTFNRAVAKTLFDANVYEAHNDNGYGLLNALKSQTAKRAFVHTIHGVLADEFEQANLYGGLSFRGRLANRFMARLARLEEKTAKEADLIVTISQYSFEKLQKHYRDVDPSKVRIVSNGVDLKKYKPAENPAMLKRQFGLTEAPVVLFVGSLIPRKGVMFLVEVAKRVVKTEPSTQFVIVGEGPLKGQLISHLATAKLTDNFVFKNGLTDAALSALYGCSDVFILPSLQEGQGIVLLEASASGKPVVAFNIGGVNEVVLEGETGLLTRRGCSEDFAEALLRLLGDASLRQRMGVAGRLFVGKHFTWDLCAKKMLTVYREALDFVI
ncbi:MAG: glycosyltransferase family 4 protein [Candidatus Bathyarchaeota archaeon]|nr:glycosyltransferase family 4 protein [Candidatus Termiticorpusculum sp.]